MLLRHRGTHRLIAVPQGRAAGSGLGADPPVGAAGRTPGSGFGGLLAGPGGSGPGSGATTALVRVNVTAVAPGALAVTVYVPTLPSAVAATLAAPLASVVSGFGVPS